MNAFLDRYLKTPWQRLGAYRAMVLCLCVVVGLMAGCAAVLMHNLAHTVSLYSAKMLSECRTGSAYLAPLLPGLGVFFCVIAARLLLRGRPYNRSLFTAIQEARRPGRGISIYHCYSHIVTCGVGVGLGISAGMEAPSALTGAAIGSTIARKLHLSRETMSLLLSAGSAAGISSVFMAPLGGTLFACEVLLPRVNSVMLIPLLIAAASGAIVSRCFRSGAAFAPSTYVWNTGNILFYVVLGIICGFFSCMIIRLNCLMGRLWSRFRNVWLKALAGSMLLYLFFALIPLVGGQGYRFINSILWIRLSELPMGVMPPSTLDCLPMLFIVISAASLLNPMVSMISLNAGGDGGLFGPSLVTGGFLGFACHIVLQMCSITSFPVVNCVTAGMAGVLAGVMHAPLTGLFLIAELLGGYGLFIPLMVVVAISSFISKVLVRQNLYFATAAALATEDCGLMERMSSEEALAELVNAPVRNLATNNYVVLKPTDTFRQILKLLLHTEQRFFPVVGKQGQLVGIVNEKSLRPHILDINLYDVLIVDDFMERPPESIDEDRPISEGAELLDRSHCNYIPVKKHSTGEYAGILENSHLIENYRTHLDNEMF